MQKKEKKREIEASSIIFNLILSVLAFSVMISLASESVEAGNGINFDPALRYADHNEEALTHTTFPSGNTQPVLPSPPTTPTPPPTSEPPLKGLEKAFTYLINDAIMGSLVWAGIIGGLAYGIANMAGLSGDQSKSVGFATF